MYIPNFAKDLLKNGAPPAPEKTLTRKWIDHIAKSIGLDPKDYAITVNEAVVLKLISDKIDSYKIRTEEYANIVKSVETIASHMSYPIRLFPRY